MNPENEDLAFYRQLWERLVGGEFTVEKLARRIRMDGGIDIENLSDSDLLELIEGRFSGPWVEAAFSFSETLATYSVPGGIETAEQIVGWVLASFMIADAINENAADWELQFNNFMDGFIAVRDQLETEESIFIFQRLFHRC